MMVVDSWQKLHLFWRQRALRRAELNTTMYTWYDTCAYVHVWSNDDDNFRLVFRYGEALYCLKTSGRVVCSVTIITMSRRGWNGWFHMLSHKITPCLRLSCFVWVWHSKKCSQYQVVLLHFAFNRQKTSECDCHYKKNCNEKWVRIIVISHQSQ